EGGGARAGGEGLPQAGLRGSHRRGPARHSLSGRTQGATTRHATTPTPALLLHRAAGAPLEQIHSGSDYRSRVTPQYLPIRASTPGKSIIWRSESAQFWIQPIGAYAVIGRLTLIRNYKPPSQGELKTEKQARNSPYGFLFGREVA